MKRKHFRNTITAVTISAVMAISAVPGWSAIAMADDLVDDSGASTLEADDENTSTITNEEESASEMSAQADDSAPLIEDDNNEYAVENSDYNYAAQIAQADAAAAAAAAAGNDQVAQAAAQIADFVSGSSVLLTPADAVQVQTYLDNLTAQEDPTGSDGELEIASYIETEMASMGYTVSEQNFHEGFLNEDLVDVPGLNIVAERGANSDMRTDQILIVAAHYDSKTDPEDDDPLANDKSGAALLLETARILSGVTNDIDLCFVFFSGEEDGNYGSARFIEQLPEEYRDRIVGVICVGPAGYTDPSDPAEVSSETSERADPNVTVIGGDSNVSTVGGSETGVIASALAAGPDRQPLLTYLIGSDVPDGDSTANLMAGSVAYYRSTGLTVPGYNSGDFTVVSDQNTAGMRKNFSDGGMKAISIFQNLNGIYTQDPLTLEWTSQADIETVTEEMSEVESETETATESLTEAETQTEPALPDSLTLDPSQLAGLADCLALICDMYMNSVGIM